jgi:hypothetical protein
MNFQDLQQPNLNNELFNHDWQEELIALEEDQQKKREFFNGEWIDELIAFGKVLNQVRVIN